MDQYATKQNILDLRHDMIDMFAKSEARVEAMMDRKIKQALEDITAILRDFMAQVDARLTRLEKAVFGEEAN